MTNPRPLRLDQNRAAEIAGEALEARPEVRDQLARYEADGQHWTLRADLIPAYGESPGDVREYVLLSIVIGPGAVIPLWNGPRELVELPDPGRGVH